MAKGSAIIGKIKGHAGNLVFRVRKGEQIIQTKPGPRGKDHLPTYNQAWNYMRFKWASLMSQVTLELTDHSFTRKYMRQSSTNKFIQANVQNFNPINKKCQNIFDTSVEAPLTFNGIQMSSGDMAPLNLILGHGLSTADLAIFETTDNGTSEIQLAAIRRNPGSQEKFETWQEALQNTQIIANAAKWAQRKEIQPGEMATIVIMTAKGYTSYGSWSEGRDLSYGLEMAYLRIKCNPDGETWVVQPSKSFIGMTEGFTFEESGTYPKINIGERYVVGACLIHSREVYGGWECDDTFMQMIDPIKGTYIDNYTWKQNAMTLYQNDWSTQEMPILDPASLTEENQQTLETGRVIATVNANNKKIYMAKVTEEVTVSGEDLEVSKKKTRKSSASTSSEE